MPVKVFCSYSHRDYNLKKSLEEHLAPLVYTGRIAAWSDSKLTAGTQFDPVILREFEAADLILVLLSPSYYDSDYCWNVELRRAVERNDTGQARVVPILLRPMMWDVAPINRYTIIPRNREALTSWPNADDAFAEITHEINRLVDERENHFALTGTGPSGALQRPPHDVTSVTAPTPIPGDHESVVFHCAPRFDSPVVLRSMGITELLPDLILQFRGDPGERRFADVWVYANTNITSRIIGLGNLSEATLSLATGDIITGLPTLRHNIRARQGAVGALGFLHVPLHELRALPPAERNLRIANVRVNAAQLAMSAKIILNLKVSDTTVTPSQQHSVALVAGTFQARVASAGPQVDLSRLAQAQSMNAGMLTERRIADRLTALMTCTGRLAGYEPLGERTRVRLDVANVPDGVSLFVTIDQVSSEPARLSATLRQTDQFGNGRGEEPKIDGHITENGRPLALSKVDLDAGRGYATWELDGGLLEDAQTVTLGLVLAYGGDPPKNLPGLGTATATVTLAPAGGPLASNQTADSNAPTPRFVDSFIQQQLFSIVPELMLNRSPQQQEENFDAKRPVQVFLCHASEDTAVVRELCTRLRADGFNPWLDDAELFPGQDWQQEIRKTVRASDAVIVFLSTRAVGKEGYIQTELRYVLEVAGEKPAGTIFVIPVKLDDCEYPESLRSYHWVSLSDMSNYPKVLRSLGQRAAQLGRPIKRPSVVEVIPPHASNAVQKLEAFQKSRRSVRITPIFPNKCRDDEFTVNAIEGDTVLFEKSSSDQRIYVPLSCIVEILELGPNEPAQIHLSGRMQWLSPSRTWKFLADAPSNPQEKLFGIAKPYSVRDFRRIERVLSGKGQELRLAQEGNAIDRLSSGWQIVYDDDGFYLRRKDRPADDILITDGV